MSELAELIAELRELRQTLAPKSSFPVIIPAGIASSTAGGPGQDNTGISSGSVTSRSYVALIKWLPRSPGGILKQVFFQGNTVGLYRLMIEDRVIADELSVQFISSSSQADLVLDFQRKRISSDSKVGVGVFVRSTTGSNATMNAIIHGEQVIEW